MGGERGGRRERWERGGERGGRRERWEEREVGGERRRKRGRGKRARSDEEGRGEREGRKDGKKEVARRVEVRGGGRGGGRRGRWEERQNHVLQHVQDTFPGCPRYVGISCKTAGSIKESCTCTIGVEVFGIKNFLPVA